jgi:predicted Zn-ribbon and HTH transcriptional regulator
MTNKINNGFDVGAYLEELERRDNVEKAKIAKRKDQKKRSKDKISNLIKTSRLNAMKKLTVVHNHACQGCGYNDRLECLDFYKEDGTGIQKDLDKAIKAAKNKDVGLLAMIQKSVKNYKLLCMHCHYLSYEY